MKRRSFLTTIGVSAMTITFSSTVTADNIIEIEDWNDLRDIDKNLSADYVLVNDLTIDSDGYDEHASPNANDGYGWYPIGFEDWEDATSEIDPFEGNFDGNGYTIEGLHMTPDLDDSEISGETGLFGMIENGEIENLKIDDVKINASSFGSVLTPFSGEETTIENLQVSNVDAFSTSSFGGIVCEISDEVKIINTEIDNLELEVESDDNGIGGFILNLNDDCTIEKSGIKNSKIELNGGMANVGGFISQVGFETKISKCYSNNVTIVGGEYDGDYPSYVGIFCSYGTEAEVEKCYANGSIEGDFGTFVGGFTTGARFDKLEDCFAHINIDVKMHDEDEVYVGGFASHDPLILENCYCNANIDVETSTSDKNYYEFSPTTNDVDSLDPEFENCYYNYDNNSDEFEQNDNEGEIIGLTEDEMVGSNAEDNMDFDFDDVWKVVSTENNHDEDDYPTLEWAYEEVDDDDDNGGTTDSGMSTNQKLALGGGGVAALAGGAYYTTMNQEEYVE